MRHWVTCQSIANPEKLIQVNLDQVVCLSDNEHGVEITYAGTDCSFVVAGNAFDLLVKGGIIPNA